jgi:multiple sugar transport system substrate-binding protein
MLNADESKVAFDGPEGQFAIRMLARLVTDGGMPNLDQPAMRAASRAAPYFGATIIRPFILGWNRQ